MHAVKDEEIVVIGGDLNRHVGKNCDRYDGVHGGYGYGVTNVEGEKILEFADAWEMVVVNTLFKKDKNKLITYRSGTADTTVDHVLVRRRDRGKVKDAKVIPDEEVTSQHRLLVMDMKIEGVVKKRKEKPKMRMRLWKLKDDKVRTTFRENLNLMNGEGSGWAVE